MPQEIYELIALAARYWFLLLMVIIVLRTFRWYRQDEREFKRRKRRRPNADNVGEWVILKSTESFNEGDILPVPSEGVIGAHRMCDLCLPSPGVAKRHCYYCYEPGTGLILEPIGKNAVTVDGVTSHSKKIPLKVGHSSEIRIGSVSVRMIFYRGKTATPCRVVPRQSQPVYAPDMTQPWMMQPPVQPPMQWPASSYPYDPQSPYSEENFGAAASDYREPQPLPEHMDQQQEFYPPVGDMSEYGDETGEELSYEQAPAQPEPPVFYPPEEEDITDASVNLKGYEHRRHRGSARPVTEGRPDDGEDA